MDAAEVHPMEKLSEQIGRSGWPTMQARPRTDRDSRPAQPCPADCDCFGCGARIRRGWLVRPAAMPNQPQWMHLSCWWEREWRWLINRELSDGG